MYHGENPSGKPLFQPGNPGQPPGTVRKTASVKRLLKRLVDEHEDELFQQVKKLALTIDDERTKAQFIRFVTEQLDGRAVESIRLTGADDGPVTTLDLAKLPPDDLRQVLAILKRAEPGPESDGGAGPQGTA